MTTMNPSGLAQQSHYPQVYFITPDRIGASVTQGMLAHAGIHSQNFASPGLLLGALPLSGPACIMFDFVMPEMNGLRLLQMLRLQHCFHPCIFASSRVEPEHIVQAMNRGAFGFIKRPFQSLELIDLVQSALNHHQALYPLIQDALNYKNLREQLSQRERQVLMYLEMGRSAREVADQLKLSFRTVENHRLRLLRKLDIANSTELITRVTSLNVLRACGVME
jgi:FixJ family two-component response regulator